MKTMLTSVGKVCSSSKVFKILTFYSGNMDIQGTSQESLDGDMSLFLHEPEVILTSSSGGHLDVQHSSMYFLRFQLKYMILFSTFYHGALVAVLSCCKGELKVSRQVKMCLGIRYIAETYIDFVL
jgi:hypothetical protein